MKINVSRQLDDLLKQTGLSLQKSAIEVLQFAEERTAHAQKYPDEPGIVAVEARNVMQFAGINAAEAGDAADAAARAKVFGFLLALISAALP